MLCCWYDGCLYSGQLEPELRMLRRRALAPLLLGFALVAGGCRDVVTPEPARTLAASAEAPNALLGELISITGSLLGLNDTVVVLQRREALSAPITVTRTIGYWGGTISIPEAGLTVRVPEGAVSSSTQFSVTAPAGRAIAYEFGPHGKTFGKALKFEQDLRVSALKDWQLHHVKLQGGYFADGGLLTDLLRAVVQELLPALVDSSDMTVRFDIKHFSGYLVAVEYED